MRAIRMIAPLVLFVGICTGLKAVDPVYDTIHIRELEIVHHVGSTALITADADTISMSLMAGRSLSELLVFQPAVYIKSAGRGALSTASFRGTDASHTKVYWNGVRLNSPMLGQVDFSLLPVWLIDDLSLLYGGASLEEGSGALGGAVILENSSDWNQVNRVSFNQEFGSYGTFTSQGLISIGNARLRSNTRLFHTRSANDYTFLNTDVIPQIEQKLENAGFSVGGMMQEIHLKPGNRDEIAVRLWYQEADRDLPSLMSHEGSAREEKQLENHLRTSLEWKSYRGPGKLSLRTAYSGTSMQYRLYHPELNYMQFDSRSQENSLFNTLEYGFSPTKGNRLNFRADYNRLEAGITDRVEDAGYSHVRNEANFRASSSQGFGRRFKLYGLIRQEWADGSWLPVMPSAGFSWDLPSAQHSLMLKGNLSRNYNLPSLNDLYWVPGGNPELRPERSLNSDLSLDYELQAPRSGIRAALNLYAARVFDWILWKPTQYRFWEAENIAEVFSRGFDVQAGADIHAGKLQLNLMLNYAYTVSTDESGKPGRGNGTQLIYIPRHTSSAYLNLNHGNYYMNWMMSYTGRRLTQPPGETPDYVESLNPYLLNDIHLGRSWKFQKFNAGIRFSIYNLFNVSYQAIRSRPMPMRNYELSLNLGI